MNTQRKRAKAAKTSSTTLENAVAINNIVFDDAPAVNVHGLRYTIVAAPAGDDEWMFGRWYVINLPPSIEKDNTAKSAYIDNFNTISSANTTTDATEFVWGSGMFACSSATPFNHTFTPATSRNFQKGGSLSVVFVADEIDGILDTFNYAAYAQMFTSS